MNSTTSPLYFLAPGNPVIDNYRTTFLQFDELESQTLSLNIHHSMIKQQDTSIVQQLVMSLQHYPELIHKLLFSLEFTFTEKEGSDLHLARRIWKLDSDYYQWFYNLQSHPFMLFFIHNEDERYYALMGDIIAAGEISVNQKPVKQSPVLTLNPEQEKLLQERLFHACLSLLVFCHGSGFNPVIYVQGLIASFDATFTYEDVLCEYANDVLKGSFRISIPQVEQE